MNIAVSLGSHFHAVIRWVTESTKHSIFVQRTNTGKTMRNNKNTGTVFSDDDEKCLAIGLSTLRNFSMPSSVPCYLYRFINDLLKA